MIQSTASSNQRPSSPKPKLCLVASDLGFANKLMRLWQNSTIQPDHFESGEDLMRQLPVDQPTVVLTGLRLKGMSGLSLAKKMHAMPYVSTVIITAHGSTTIAIEAMKSGVLDFLSADVCDNVLHETISKAIETTCQNFQCFQLNDQVSRCYHALSVREKQICHCVLMGHSSKQTAEQLHISKHTIDIYRSKILKKFRVSNVQKLIALLIGTGVFTREELNLYALQNKSSQSYAPPSSLSVHVVTS